MSITIQDSPNPSPNNQSCYTVNIFGTSINTTVTSNPFVVDRFIRNIHNTFGAHYGQIDPIIIGLDVETRPPYGPGENRPATIQLCVDGNCLIFQIIHASYIPDSLSELFECGGSFCFVGVGVREDARKLMTHYNLHVANVVELGSFAAEREQRNELKNFSLKNLTKEIVGWEIEKPRQITMSRWDVRTLTYA
ncbi:Werner syndrome-like exonuclease [Thalictrum thalictroides]|uniref:Werner syndrome-like exonuclease n=1 Tax=Thalictrum thalictroides TaxID=46969 RepID=A0A7J6WBW1_THATH|nr:Werner syndrome-like exonuclease [Thalictrum thalictroides]